MPFLSFFRRKTVDTAAARRERLLQTGRITEGTILDCDGASDEDITQITYVYVINGAEYESSENLTEVQRKNPAAYTPGAKVSIRYDQRQPGNSIVV
jgi:hypothetical protein